ncbi:MAG: hypothetical protein LBL96_07820 [Clostridiales bacterium]|nr:hypothetical protein [Clostridiales bacterium]
MRDRLQALLNDIRDRLNSLSRKQKIQLVVTAVVFLAVLVATIYLAVRTRMEVLVDNKDLIVISQMKNAIDSEGIETRVVNNGRGLAVDEKRVVDAQVIIAQSDFADATGGTGFTYLDALNYSGMGTTETIKRENLKKVKESELALALRLFEGIQKATVNLTMPDDNYYFIRPAETARASAVLTVSRPLDNKESLAVARFLCASVKGLTLENIEVSDQNYNIVYSGLQESTEGSGSQYDQELLRKNEIEMKVKVALAPLFDSVTVINDNLIFNWDKVTETSDIISSPISGSDTGVVIKEETEKTSSASQSSGAVPGIAANDQTTNTYQTNNSGGSSASTKTGSTEYGYNRTQKTLESASGVLDTQASTIAVMVYRNKTYDEAALTAGDRLNGQSWDAYKLSMRETPLSIDFDPIKDLISKGTGLAASNISVYGYEVPVFNDAQQTGYSAWQIAVFALLALLLAMLAFALFKGVPAPDVASEPELSVEELLETTRLEEQKESEKARLQEIELDKELESKRLIEKFVNERPEAVAQLLRNWLNDNWE